jgi:succinate dehydrogenase/fumarate reductase flavoprotein subunit
MVPEETVTTDLLVIGAGFAGCFAAIRARELGVDVVMVEQLKSGFSGMSGVGTHLTRVVHPDDDFDSALKVTVLSCEYMIDQEYAEGALAETWDRFQEMLKYGADFDRDDKGQFVWNNVGDFHLTQYPELQQRTIGFQPMASFKHLLKLNAAAVQHGVRVQDRIMITDLLLSDNKVVGAVGFHTREGTFFTFKAKAVVMAAGAFGGGGGSTRIQSLTGDAIAMGLKAGAEIRNMEFGRREAFALAPPGKPTWVGVTTGGGLGVGKWRAETTDKVRVVNAMGEDFLEKYEFTRRLLGRRYHGPPWRIQLQAWMKECREVRGPCYLDFGEPTNDRYELGFGASGSSQNGGLRINPQGATTIEGLYAGGTASDMCGAMHYSIPANIMGSHITGRRAGESAAQFIKSISSSTIDRAQICKLKSDIYQPLKREHGMNTNDLRMKIKKAWLNIDLREETRLKKAIDDFNNLQKEAGDLVADDYHRLAECHKLDNYILCSRATAEAALARQETRLEHIRDDYPLTDNKVWLKWVVSHLVENDLRTCLVDIPIERWKYQPERIVINRLRLKGEAI